MSGSVAGTRHGRGGLMRWSGRRPSGDVGGSTLDYVGTLALVVLLLGAVLAAYLANTGTVTNRTASLICQILTLGQGDCGDSTTDDARQPDEPCVVGSESSRQAGSISITYVEVGGGRTLAIEERSDGSYRVTVEGDAELLATAGVGGHASVTVDDKTIAQGAGAGVKGGVTFNGGMEWIAHSEKEVAQIVAADAWSKMDSVVGAVNPVAGIALPWVRKALNIGEQFPPPDSVYVTGGLFAAGNADAGYGPANAGAKGTASQALGARHDKKTGHTTFYFETTIDGSASAEVAGVLNQKLEGDRLGAGVGGKMTVMTAITVDADRNLVSGSRSALAAGQSAGLTNMLFGGDPSALMSDGTAGGTQWDATLPVHGAADRDAVVDLLLSSNISPASVGLHMASPNRDRLPGLTFMDAVRDRGDLTRYSVATDDTTHLAASGEVSATAKVGVGFDVSSSEMTASNPQYWNGREFVDRTNC